MHSIFSHLLISLDEVDETMAVFGNRSAFSVYILTSEY